jgi:hypothetical protein
LLVHAINERSKQFYEHYGFQVSPVHPMTLMLRLPAISPAVAANIMARSRGTHIESDELS